VLPFASNKGVCIYYETYSGELFKMIAGVDLAGVPYRSGPEALTSLLGGQVQVTFDPLGNSIEHTEQAGCGHWL